MCWACENPDRPITDYLEQLHGIITDYGFAVHAVERDSVHPPWAHTIGLTRYGLPELLVTGMDIEDAATLLNEVAQPMMQDDEIPAVGSQSELDCGPRIEIVEVAVPDVHLSIAVGIYGDVVTALQVVYADEDGHWPWSPKYRGGLGGQPVLGMRGRSR